MSKTLEEIAHAVAKDVLGFGWTSMTEPLPAVTAHAESAILAALADARGSALGRLDGTPYERCPLCRKPVAPGLSATAVPAPEEECSSRECDNWPMFHFRTRRCPPTVCAVARVNAEGLCYACRLPLNHDGDHHPNPCGHDGCTGLECRRPRPALAPPATPGTTPTNRNEEK